MKKLLTLFLWLVLSAQALPARQVPSEQQAAILAPVNAIFAALETGDATALLRHVYPDGWVTAPGRGADGAVRKQSWAQFAARMKPETAFEERIFDPVVHVDQDVAVVWARFTVVAGGKLVNCGYDHFDLVREQKAWKVMNLTFSSNMKACEAP
ncbi:nuclear transport factor 2 family protein [Sphingobium algorifonticola]|uniref:Nuclear transport factor 2 family protein n=1 Tax=Sphingobium algorifonticola TaxID=2008318 RepID=A0A437J749_9SPHN|nr:nuclear transport factor 2 family protein [Sphingobium algorifonticola]RVT40836.1 hypothetical protein ENE74_10185 [Sphingobium algorifonticola]